MLQCSPFSVLIRSSSWLYCSNRQHESSLVLCVIVGSSAGFWCITFKVTNMWVRWCFLWILDNWRESEPHFSGVVECCTERTCIARTSLYGTWALVTQCWPSSLHVDLPTTVVCLFLPRIMCSYVWTTHTLELVSCGLNTVVSWTADVKCSPYSHTLIVAVHAW